MGAQAERDELISTALSTPEGRRKLAESMMQPVRGRGRECPVCGYPTHDMAAHCREVDDDAHRVAEVMES